MAARLQVRLKDQAGSVVAIFDDWKRLEWWLRLDAPGGHVFQIRDDDARVALFLDSSGEPIKDLQFEIWRSDLTTDPTNPLDLYREYAGFTRAGQREIDKRDDQIFTSDGVEYTDLVRRAIVAYAAGSAGGDKSGVGETVIKGFVDENIGPAALAGGGRDRDHVFSGLTIEADAAGGLPWSGARSRRNLLEICQEIALPTDVRFRVEHNGVAAYIFNCRATPYGTDRSTAGLVPATGLNGAGNPPLVFGLDQDNMLTPMYRFDAAQEANVVIVAGQGEGANRTIVIRTSADTGDSLWNDIEVFRDARDTNVAANLNARGDEVLNEREDQETFSFGVAQVPSTLYGRDYVIGDLVTAVFRTVERDLEIVGVHGLSDGDSPEVIEADMSDRP